VRALAWRAAVVAAVAVIGLLVATRAWSSPPQPVTLPTQPNTWQLPRLSGGGDVRMSDLHGHPVVLDFFASWCTACRGELPGMVAVAHDLAGKVTFAGVDSLENGNGLAMARQYGITGWPLARDVGGVQDSGLHDALGARGMPVTAFYNSSGRLVSVVMGAISEADLRSRISSIFGIAS
jgi:cytochrome c biogenesis protein CcmG/thiol:disulfide interchange protein DsbE